MSNPFTSSANATWQELLAGDSPYLDEITLAYSERRQAISQSAYTPTDDKDVQAVGYWTALQNWLETNCVSFIDHVSGPLNPAGTAFLYFTLATWRAAAELNANGFRRVPEGVEWDGITDPVWSYGQMQAGDIIGPWIFEDIQKGFGALQWNARYDGWVNAVSYRGRSLDWGDCASGATLAEAKTLAESYFNAGKVSYYTTIIEPEAYTGVQCVNASLYRAAMIRAYNQADFTTILATIGIDVASIGLYFIGSPFHYGGATGIFDAQGDGVTESFELFEEKTVAPFTFEVIRDAVHPAWPAGTPAEGQIFTLGYITRTGTGQSTKGFLFKWDFTNA